MSSSRGWLQTDGEHGFSKGLADRANEMPIEGEPSTGVQCFELGDDAMELLDKFSVTQNSLGM